MYKRYLGLLLTLLLLVAGCGTASSPSGPSPAAAPAAPSASAPADTAPAASAKTIYPLTVKDMDGREITIEKEPMRIVSFAPSYTEIVFALGAGERLVGRTDFCDFPAEAASVPSVGGVFKPEYEKILAGKPDLVLMIGGNNDVRATLENDHKLTVLQLDPQNLDEVYGVITTVGQVINRQEEADRIVSDMKAKVAGVESLVANVPAAERPKVFYEVWNDPLMTAGPNSFVSDLIRLAGGVNIADDAQEKWPVYPLEQVVKHNPDIVITSDAALFEEMKAKKRSGWESIRALQEGQVVMVEDVNLVVRPGPRLVRGLEWLASVLHPDLVKR